MLTNVALASFGTRVMADSFFPWYRTWPVNDGKRNELEESGRWGKVRWLSAPTPEPHWLQILFPGPQLLSRVEIYWARDSGTYLMPTAYRLERWSGQGWEPVPEVERVEEPDGRCTVITLNQLQTDRLRLYMPARCGRPGSQENLLGVAEFEAYSPAPNQGEPSRVVVLPAYLESRANPFWLNWAPVPGAGQYQVEWSRSVDFPPADSFTARVAANYAQPPAPLEPGRWYWRVAPVVSGNPGEWSEPAIIDLTDAFRYQPAIPGPDAWKRTHPRLPWADLDRQALLAQAEGAKQEVWAKTREAARAAIPHVAQIRNMQDAGGTSEGLPAEPPGFEDGLWTIERWREIVAAGAKVLEAVTLNSFVYAVTGEAEARENARRWLLHAAGWDPLGSTGIESVDHAAHDVLVGLAAGYDGLYHDLTAEERARVRSAIVERCRALWRYLNPFDNDPNNNHPWFQTTAMAVGAMAVWDEVEEAREWITYATQIYLGRFIALGGIDGEWHEGSDYWTYSLGFVFDFCDAVATCMGLDLYQHPWLQQTAHYKLYVAPPGGPGLSFGDTHKHAPGGEDAAQMFRLASAQRDPYAQWYGLQAVKGAKLERPGLLLRLMLWWDPTLEERSPEALPMARLFQEAGFAKLHTTLEHQNGTHLAMHAGRFHGLAGGHGHADQNHFMLYAGGEPLVLDSGCYDYYGSPHFNGWYIRTRAHNTILVDGAEQTAQKAGADGQFLAFLHSPAFDYLLGDASAPGVYGGKLNRFHRHMIFLRPTAPGEMGSFVLFDDLAAPEPALFDWLLHTPAEPVITALGAEARLRVARPGAHLALALRAGGELSAEVKQGFPQGLEPTRSIPDEFHTAFRTQSPRAEQSFLAVLEPHPPESTPASVRFRSERSLRMERNGKAESIWFGGAGDGWKTDGKLLAVTESANGCERWMAVGATYLEHQGRQLLAASAPVTLAWWQEPGGGAGWLCQSDAAQTIALHGQPVPVAKGESRS